MRQLGALIGGGDEGVVFVEDVGIDVVRDEVGNGGELIFIVVGHEFVVAVVQHFGRETASEGERRGAEVGINGVRPPTEEEFDDILVDFGAQEGGGPASAEGTDGDFGRGDAGDGLHIFGGKAESGGELVRGEGDEGAACCAGGFVIAVERSGGRAVVGEDVQGNAFERADGTDGLAVPYTG